MKGEPVAWKHEAREISISGDSATYSIIDTAHKDRLIAIVECDGISADEALKNAVLISGAEGLFAMLKLAKRYLEHPDVQEVTKDMALSGKAVLARIQETLASVEGE